MALRALPARAAMAGALLAHDGRGGAPVDVHIARGHPFVKGPCAGVGRPQSPRERVRGRI